LKKIIVLFILILPLTLWAQKQEFAIVDRVIDGDTIVLLDSSQTRVRFIGVDTPETKHPRKPIEFYGLESSAYTTKQLSSQKILLVFFFPAITPILKRAGV